MKINKVFLKFYVIYKIIIFLIKDKYDIFDGFYDRALSKEEIKKLYDDYKDLTPYQLYFRHIIKKIYKMIEGEW